MGGGEGFQMPHYLIKKILSPRLEPLGQCGAQGPLGEHRLRDLCPKY